MKERKHALMEQLSNMVVLSIQLPEAVLASSSDDDKESNTAPTLLCRGCQP